MSDKPRTYLKFKIEAFTFEDTPEDGIIHQISKIYPLEYIDESYRTFFVYEILDQIDEIRKALK